ncbi:RNA 2'-phosphotransferase [Actinosynnema sp. NPDC023587]|uniref:RNA 2'-phosphotransferase n=1 Tax=Actinosynnema sp. NPDC023587 TaxID=3154695 RepID=UPI0034017A5A
MREREPTRLSKRMSKHLRHSPEAAGLTLDPAGWVDLDAFVRALRTTHDDVRRVVTTNDKQRFTIEDGRIRANQGHTVEVDLDLPVAEPPAVLYHGTIAKALPDILDEGLRPMSRHDVHLSATVDTALRVGARRGKPVILEVAAHRMRADGYEFRVSANGVWLAPAVPPAYLDVRRR